MLRKNTGYYDGWYVVPSGHVEAGELPIDAMVRETKEEIGIDLERSSIRAAHTMYRTRSDETGDRADFFFEVTDWQGEPTNVEPDKCEHLRWFSVQSLPENMMHHVKEAIGHIQNGIVYSEVGADRVMRNPNG